MEIGKKVAAGILAGLVLGFIFGFYTAFQIANSEWLTMMSIPASHRAIIENMEVIDTRANFKLTPKLVDSGVRSFGKGIPLELFTNYEEYQQTTWIWQRHGDTEFAMTIWGPGNDGKTHMIELGRTAADPFEVKVAGETKLVIPQITEWKTVMEGYYEFEVIVSG